MDADGHVRTQDSAQIRHARVVATLVPPGHGEGAVVRMPRSRPTAARNLAPVANPVFVAAGRARSVGAVVTAWRWVGDLVGAEAAKK